MVASLSDTVIPQLGESITWRDGDNEEACTVSHVSNLNLLIVM